MSWTQPKPQCNACGQIRREANYWWQLLVRDGRITIAPIDTDDQQQCWRHACGSACLGVLMGTAMREVAPHAKDRINVK